MSSPVSPFKPVAHAVLEASIYRVMDYPRERIEAGDFGVLNKGIAYRYSAGITRGLFPYRGIVGDDFSYNTSKVGIYVKKISHRDSKIVIVRPRTNREKEIYRIGNERDLVAAVLNGEYVSDDFFDNELRASDIGGDVYLPPIYADDDSLNMLMKTAIRLKKAPFEQYGRRLEAYAVDRSKGVEGNNAKNNFKRGLKSNRSMSDFKFEQAALTWELLPVFLLKDKEGAMNPMDLPEGSILAIFPQGEFEIDPDKIVNISDLVRTAIAESAGEDNRRRSSSKKKSAGIDDED